jgi:small-conductance mechanosensitive channel
VSDFDFEDEDQELHQESEGIKSLRKQAKTLAKENAELQQQLRDALNASRRANLNDALRELGVNTKLSKYIPNEIEPTKDSIKQWLNEDGELFGIKVQTSTEAEPEVQTQKQPEVSAQQTGIPQALIDAFQRSQNPDSFGGVPTQGAEAQALAQMKSLAEKAGNSFFAFDELHRQLQK